MTTETNPPRVLLAKRGLDEQDRCPAPSIFAGLAPIGFVDTNG